MAVEMLKVPAGTTGAPCPRGCGVTVYWIERPRAGGGKGIVRLPVDCDVLGGSTPDSLSSGVGVNHFTLCDEQEDR